MEQVRSRKWTIFLVVLTLCLAGVRQTFAQVGTGTLTGTVVDDQGGAVPGALVAVTEEATGAVRTIAADREGVFRLSALPQGRYSVRVEVESFSPFSMTDIVLAAAEVRNLGRMQLQVGARTETVTVTAEATPVQTATSSRYGTVTAEQLTNIQMKGRDIYGLLAVVPGVMDSNIRRDFTTWTSMRDVTINGSPVTNKNIVVDGVSVVDEGGAGNAFVNPNIDSVGEVQIVANGFTAENGRNNGGLIMMTTKSGTNSLKGSGWYNAKRRAWNANEYLRIQQGLDKPLYHVNISGYSIGGPIVIPGVLRTGKLFFFASQEFTDDLQPTSISRVNFPTALERQGDFSQTRFGNSNTADGGSLLVIRDPQTGQPFANNVIPADRFHPMGVKMLHLLPLPNNIHNPQNNQYHTSNSAHETDPRHSRTSNTVRIDAVLNDAVRGSFRWVRDREDNWNNNRFTQGWGVVNNFVPGWLYSWGSTQVLSPTMVNEMTLGFGHNNYGFKGDYDYTQYYRSAMGIDPPMLKSGFGPYSDPPVIGRLQVDEYPYLPIMGYGGGQRSGLASLSLGVVGGRVMPAANRNDRWSFQNDLSWTRGRHNLKFGFYTEWTAKTEPGSTNYAGNYNFGHTDANPFSTGYGYANALLGEFQTYTEQTKRVDKDRRHWQTEGYLQDSWRVNPRLTLDYGVRLTHSGPWFDMNNSTAGFYAELWDPAQAGRIYRQACITPNYVGTQACSGGNTRAIDPLFPNVFHPTVNLQNFVPGTGSQINGMRAGGMPGKKPGEYYGFPQLVAAPRAGFAWDVNGDGKTALRASAGLFWNYPRGGWDGYVGQPPVVFSRVVRWANIDDVADFQGTFVESPINVLLAEGEVRKLEKAYNGNITFQRDIGFNTTVEASYVANFTWIGGRTADINAAPLFAYANPDNLFNRLGRAAAYLRTTYPGMGSVTKWFETYNGQDVNTNTLRYHGLQLSVQRRLTQGLQMGLAYTLAKGEGFNGWDPFRAEYGGEALLRQAYWGPTAVDRRHNLVFNYSYMIPDPTPNVPVLTWVLRDWQISGVTKYLTGTTANPSCSVTPAQTVDVATPTLTPGVNANCVLTGQPINQVTRDPNLPEETQRHFNVDAFTYPVALSATEGNFGNTPLGLLRHPSWQNWDMTFSRRFPIPALGRNAQARVQLQFFNVFNQVQFTTMNTTMQRTATGALNSTTSGHYTATTPARQFGITTRFDF